MSLTFAILVHLPCPQLCPTILIHQIPPIVVHYTTITIIHHKQIVLTYYHSSDKCKSFWDKNSNSAAATNPSNSVQPEHNLTLSIPDSKISEKCDVNTKTDLSDIIIKSKSAIKPATKRPHNKRKKVISPMEDISNMIASTSMENIDTSLSY